MRISATIQRFVVQLNSRQHFFQLGHGPENVGALGGVGLHDFKFFFGQCTRFFQDAIFNPDLAHVV